MRRGSPFFHERIWDLVDGNILGSSLYLGGILGNGQAQDTICKGGPDVLLAQLLAYIEGALAGAGVALFVKVGSGGFLLLAVLCGYG